MLEQWLFVITLFLSEGSTDGQPQAVEISLKTSSEKQCQALRTEAIKMLGGSGADPAKLVTTVNICHQL